jgi:hypothetical protein
MRNPTVVSGTRSARDPLGRKPENRHLSPTPVYKSKDAGAMIFRSKASDYVFILENPQETFNPVTGKRDFSAPIKKAKFANYIFETSDDAVIGRLMASQGYGLGRDFWLLQDEQAVQTAEKAQELLTQLSALGEGVKNLPPELRERITKALGSDVRKSFEPGS